MMNQLVCTGVLAAMLGLSGVGARAQGADDVSVGKRPMTFADLQRMKRVSDPQISPSGKWVMFSVTEVDLEKNAKVNHLWVVPIDGSGAGRQERQVTFWKEGETGGRFSPDGRHVLFTATDSKSGLSQIFLATWNDRAGTLGTPTRLTNVNTEADGAVWSPDSQRILFVSRVYPECSEGSSWLEEENCDRRKEADAAANPVKAQVWDRLLYRHWNNYVGPRRSHVLVVSVTDGNLVRDLTPTQDIGDAEAPTFSLGGPIGYAWAPDSHEIAYVTNVELVPAASTNNDVFTLRLDDPVAKPVRVSASLGSDDAPAYSPDGKWLAFRSQKRPGYESDRFRLMLLDREGKTTDELLPKFDRWVDEFAWGADSATIYFASGVSGSTQIFSVKVDGSELNWRTYVNTNLERGEYGDLHISSDGRLLVSTRMTVAKPAEVFLTQIGVDSGMNLDDFGYLFPIYKSPVPGSLESAGYGMYKTEQLTHMNRAVLASYGIHGGGEHDGEPMEGFTFDGAGGTKVHGFIVRPPNFDEDKKYPVKFLIHGGPQGAWGDAWSYRWNPELMAASGYVVVMVNPRGSTGYGQAFVDGVNGDWGGKPYVDLMKGLDYAEQHFPFIDKTRECALGASYGGYMADWILTHTNRFACIVTHDGMFNPQSAYGSTEELWFAEWEFRQPPGVAVGKGQAGKATMDPLPAQPWNNFDKPVALDPFRKWSPMLSIRNARTPTLVIHSQRDYRLDVSEGLQLFTALQRLNVPSKMLYFPDEGHWVLKPQNSKLWYETVGDWCDRWTRTNMYAQSGFEGPAAPTAKVPDARTGQSRPAEMEESQVRPAPAAVPEKAPESVAAPVVREAPPVRPRGAAAEKAGPASDNKAAPTTDSKATFLIAISAPIDEVRVGSDARIIITLRNLASHQILFAHRPGTNNPEFSYTIVVRNEKGRVVEETAYGRESRVNPQSEGRTVDYVQPGQSVVQTAHLGQLVNLTKPGDYTIRVTRKDPETQTVVMSNEVTLSVVP
jgi:dipeptidyl aminopeptidase/acylaminoacyl peptidase